MIHRPMQLAAEFLRGMAPPIEDIGFPREWGASAAAYVQQHPLAAGDQPGPEFLRAMLALDIQRGWQTEPFA